MAEQQQGLGDQLLPRRVGNGWLSGRENICQQRLCQQDAAGGGWSWNTKADHHCPQPHSEGMTPDQLEPRPIPSPRRLRQDLDQPDVLGDPTQGHSGQSGAVGGDINPPRAQEEVQDGELDSSDPGRGSGAILVQEEKREEPVLDSLDGVPPQDPHPVQDQEQNRDPATVAANQDGALLPALVVTAAAAEERRRRAASATPLAPSRAPQSDPPPPPPPADLSLGSSGDAGDMSCCDLLSLRSDSISLSSEAAVSRRSEEDDTRSVAASSVMSLFHRLQLDPLEKDWLRSSALGDEALQRRLLAQEPGLVFKKTALHWAAKQGRQDSVNLMLRFGADVNVRSGYTALHLASIHGHQQLVHSLIHTHNAQTALRDYHGKTAAHYWSGCSDVFNKPDFLPGEKLLRGRKTQRYVLPSLLLTRSRSQGQLNLEFGPLPRSTSHDALPDL